MRKVKMTSRDTFNMIQGNRMLSEWRAEVHRWIYFHGPCTAMEVEVGLANKNANKRTSELRDRGVIRELRRGPCPVTGRRAIFWVVTGKLPGSAHAGGKWPSKKMIAWAASWLMKSEDVWMNEEVEDVVERLAKG